MWTCSLLKQNAKQALRGRYWRSVLVCFVLGLLGVSTGGTDLFKLGLVFNLNLDLDPQTILGHGSSGEVWSGRPTALTAMPAMADPGWHSLVFTMLGIGLAAVLVILAIVLCWSIFFISPLGVGMARYFMESRQAPSPFGTAFSVFDSGYLNVVKVMLLTTLKVLGGVFLFVVPGIYWGYCYRLVPYLLAENPYMTTRRAMELSKQMMQGEKWHSFVLELSFFGWELLAALTGGLGMIFLVPYIQATFAELYAALRSKAFAYGLSDGNELAGFVVRDGHL